MRLAIERLVTGEPQRGFRVTEATEAGLADLMQARRGIERLCLAQSIAQGDAAWEAEITAAFTALSAAKLPRSRSDPRRRSSGGRRITAVSISALIAACESQWLLGFWNVLADHSERYRRLRLQHRPPPRRRRPRHQRRARSDHAGGAGPQRARGHGVDGRPTSPPPTAPSKGCLPLRRYHPLPRPYLPRPLPLGGGAEAPQGSACVASGMALEGGGERAARKRRMRGPQPGPVPEGEGDAK